MPKLPDASSFGPRPAPRGARGVPSADLSQEQRAAGRLGKEMAALGERVQNRVDTEQVSDAMTRFQEAERQKTFLDENAIFRRQGGNAKGAYKEFQQWWESSGEDFASQLKNNNQRRIFQDWLSRRKDQVFDSVATHETGEREKAFVGSLEARINSSVEQAAGFYSNPELLRQSRLDIQDAIDTLSDHAGWSPDQRMLKRLNSMTAMHSSVIDAAIDTNPEYAKNYYEQNKKEIKGTDRDDIESKLRTATLRSQSQTQADRIMSESDSLSSALAEARKINSPEIRDEVVSRVKLRFGEKNAARIAERDTAQRAAQRHVEDGGNPLDLPSDVRIHLSSSQLSSLETRYRQVREGIEPVQNDRAWLEFAGTSRQQLAGMSQQQLYERYRTKLDNPHWNQAVSRWSEVQAITRGEKSGHTTNDGYLTTKQMVDGAMSAAGIDPTPKPNTDDAKRANLFRFRVDEAIRLEQQAKQRELTNSEKQTVIDGLLVEGTVKDSGWIWDDKRRVFEARPGEILEFGNVTIDDVPASEADKIAAALRRANRPVTDEDIVELYRARLERNAE